MDATVLAAGLAAAASIVGVGLNARIVRVDRRRQWRRDAELPLVADVLNESADARRSWREMARRRESGAIVKTCGSACHATC
jgi:hypothetical protein